MTSGYPPDWRPPQERPDPSEQPCREGTTIPPFVPPQQPPTPGGGGGGGGVPPTSTPVQLTILSLASMSARMDIGAGNCIPSGAGAVFAVDDFNGWRHADGASANLIGGFASTADSTISNSSANRGWFLPWVVSRAVKVKSFGVNVTAAAAAGAKARVIVYDSKPRPNNYPRTLVADCSVISGADILIDTIGFKSQTINTTFTGPALYWVGAICSVNPNRFTVPRAVMHGPNILGRKKGVVAFPTGSIQTDITFPASAVTPAVSSFPAVGTIAELDTTLSPIGVFGIYTT